MNGLTLLETVLIIYIIAVNVLGVITIIMAQYARNKVSKVSDIILGILLVVAVPISLPIVLYLLTFDKLKRRKRE